MKDKNCWYWVCHPQEGDIFYPIFVNDDGRYLLDGRVANTEGAKDLDQLIWSKAVMPEHE